MTQSNSGTQSIQDLKSNEPDFLVYPASLTEPSQKMKKVTFRFFDPVSTIDTIKNIANINWSSNTTKETSGFDFTSFSGFISSVKNKADEFSKSLGNAKEQVFNWDSVNGLAEIVLPIPNNLNDTMSQDWQEESMPFVTEGINALSQGARIATQAVSGYGTPGDSNKSTFSAREYAPHPPIADPLKWQVYQGAKSRSFNFSYEFIPQNQEEAKIIATICLLFKKLAAPVSDASSVVMLPPARVKISFSNPYLEAMLNCGVCVLTSVKTDFKGSSDSFVFTYADGFVKSISLDLSFTEFRPKYSQDYELDAQNITSDLGSLINSSKMSWNKKRNGLGL